MKVNCRSSCTRRKRGDSQRCKGLGGIGRNTLPPGRKSARGIGQPDSGDFHPLRQTRPMRWRFHSTAARPAPRHGPSMVKPGNAAAMPLGAKPQWGWAFAPPGAALLVAHSMPLLRPSSSVSPSIAHRFPRSSSIRAPASDSGRSPVPRGRLPVNRVARQ